MTLVSSGEIALAGSTSGRSVAVELGQSATGTISLNDTNVRTLLQKSSGTISLYDAYGKSNAPAGNYSRPLSATSYVNRSVNFISNTENSINNNGTADYAYIVNAYTGAGSYVRIIYTNMSNTSGYANNIKLSLKWNSATNTSYRTAIYITITDGSGTYQSVWDKASQSYISTWVPTIVTVMSYIYTYQSDYILTIPAGFSFLLSSLTLDVYFRMSSYNYINEIYLYEFWVE